LARLAVPATFRPALAKLSSLTDESAQELLAAINASPPLSNPKTMASRIGLSVPSIPSEDLNRILRALFALSAVRVINKVPIPGFLDDVCESVSTKKEVNAVALKSRLEQLLQSEPLILATKASAIQREHANVVVNARILTDLRPVFLDGPESLRGAVIVHTLKLTCIQASDHREFFFALDDDDLGTLQKTIIRAEAKSKALRAFTEKSGLPTIDPGEE
jgi:hypothetical protein